MSKLEKIDAAIRQFYEQTFPMVSEDLVESILYSVNGGGKRIRPVLLLDLVEGFGFSLTDAHYQVAASLEMIHTGSLIHDDLPAMDDDDYRRGRLTSHKQFDEATAILAGDSLFLDAFGLLSLADFEADIVMSLVQALSMTSGTFGMVAGQMLDMKGEGKTLELSELAMIHLNKTGRLLAYPFQAAAILTKQDRDTYSKLCQVGALVGHAFQVRDDILDVTADFAELGKTPQKDIRAEKATYPSLVGLEASYRILDDILDQAVAIFKDLEERKGFQATNLLSTIESLRLHG